MRYYLAYGSNLSTKQMARRCPGARLVATGLLEGYQLEFMSAFGGSAFATIHKKIGSKVPIALFTLTDEDERILDIYEGVRGGHYFKDYIEVEIEGTKVNALVYIMNLRAKKGLPTQTYVDVIHEGYKEHKFKIKYIKDALQRLVD